MMAQLILFISRMGEATVSQLLFFVKKKHGYLFEGDRGGQLWPDASCQQKLIVAKSCTLVQRQRHRARLVKA